MRVTLQTDYALRVLLFAATKGERLATIAEIADAFRISRNHLMKVVHRLAKAGYLETVRGKNGGIRLKRDAREINVGDVVREIEDTLAVLGCLSDENYCVIDRACILKRAFRDASSAFLAVLDGYTLADLVKPRLALANILQIPARA